MQGKTPQYLVRPAYTRFPLDTRVLLANTQKKYEAIFNGLGILAHNLQNTTAGIEVTYEKMIELDNKVDAIMKHLGIELAQETAETGPAETATEEPSIPAETAQV
jgi:hypothetical protein